MVIKEKIPWQVIACALFVLIFTNLFSFFIFDHIPHINDEIAYLFQAKIFKTGRLFAPSPCGKESFDFTHMVNNGKWYSQYPPGFPILLVGGLIFGAPWIINTLLAALSIVIFYLLGTELYSRRIGILAAFLGTISIWFLIMSSSMMSHTSCMFFCSLFLLFWFRSLKNPTVWNGVFAGASLGMALIIRPHPAAFFSLPFLVYIGISFLKNLKFRFKNIISLGLLLMLFFAILLVYNQITNGHPLRMGYEVAHTDHGLGFGKAGYSDVPHSPEMGAFNLVQYIEELNYHLFGWPLSSLIIFIPLLLVAPPRKETRKTDILLSSGFFSLFFSLYFYWGTYVLIGPRMIFETLPVIIVLAARGLYETPNLLTKIFKKVEYRKAVTITTIITLLLVLYAFLIRLPSMVWIPDAQWFYQGYAYKFSRVAPDLHNRIVKSAPKNSLVIIKLSYYPRKYLPNGWWGSGFQYNDPQLSNDYIYAQYREGKFGELLDCYPQRKILLYYGTLEKGMLIPIIEVKGKITVDKAFPADEASQKCIELIEDPIKFHKLYSPAFTAFIQELYAQDDFYTKDVFYLFEKSQEAFNLKAYEQAVLYLEAGLQIEKDPFVRFFYLNRLANCYLKTGNIKESKIITEKINTSDEITNYYNVLPEKGF